MDAKGSPGAYDASRAEGTLHGERLIATVRLVLFVFRSVIMIGVSLWSAGQVETIRGLRLTLIGIYLVTLVGVLLVLRRIKPSSPKLRRLPHVLNVIDYGFVVLMSLPGTGIDPAFTSEVSAMSLAIILSFSVAREGVAQAVVSTVLACGSYLVVLQWAPRTSTAATLFVLGSYVASATLSLRVVIGLRRRAMDAMRLGQYTLTEKVGQGGMGVVYKATHAMLRRPTAVKLLQTSGSKDKSLVRFEREVQLTAQLSHPNTIAIYDYGRTPDGVFYYAMEYLDGANLEQLVQVHGPLPPERVVHLLLQVCGSLGEAHGIALIHRDVKPANIVICERGGMGDVVKVLDFGLVKQVNDASSVAATRDDILTGTPLYMAPEAVVTPEKVDARSDLYAVGCVGYFLLTGVPVFDGRSLVEVCSHHLHTPPEPPSRRAQQSIPQDLESVILWCLQKDPAKRPPSARALSERLAACECADAWTDSRVREWWAQHGRSVSRLTAARPLFEAERSLAVDLEARGAE